MTDTFLLTALSWWQWALLAGSSVAVTAARCHLSPTRPTPHPMTRLARIIRRLVAAVPLGVWR